MNTLPGCLAMAAFALGLVASSPSRAEGLERTASELTRAKDYERVGHCLMRSKRKLMLSFVLSDDVSGTNFESLCLETVEYNRITREGIDTSRLGGAVAAAFMRSTDMARFDQLIANTPPLDHGEPVTVDGLNAHESFTQSQKVAYVHNVNWRRSNHVLAECAIRKDPALSRELSTSKISSREEAALLSRFAKTVSECSESQVSGARLQAIRQVEALLYLQLAVKAHPPLRAELD